MTAVDLDIPPYRLLLPAGWESVPADRAGIDTLIRRSSEKFRAQHRPDLDSQMRTLLEKAYRRLQSARAVALYLQTEAPEMALPLSITASVAEDEFGGTLDRQIAGLFRDRNSAFLDDDRRIVRWEAGKGPAREVEGVASHFVDYLTPIPGTGRRRALQFTAVIPLPANPDGGDRDVVVRLVALSDLIISTLTWEARP